MELNFDWFPDFNNKKISICDSKIDKIIYSSDAVQFCFNDGLYLIKNDNISKSGKAYIELQGCDSDEFSCYIIKQKTSKNGAVLKGKPIPLKEIKKLLDKKKFQIEICLELYDFNYMYWRGEVFPYKKRGLSDLVIIEMSGNFPVRVGVENTE